MSKNVTPQSPLSVYQKVCPIMLLPGHPTRKPFGFVNPPVTTPPGEPQCSMKRWARGDTATCSTQAALQPCPSQRARPNAGPYLCEMTRYNTSQQWLCAHSKKVTMSTNAAWLMTEKRQSVVLGEVLALRAHCVHIAHAERLGYSPKNTSHLCSSIPSSPAHQGP